MKTILETDSDFICDIQALCFLMLLPEIFQLPSLKDFADFAGISTENAVKLLKMFEKEGLIDLNEKDIILVKQAALPEISRGDDQNELYFGVFKSCLFEEEHFDRDQKHYNCKDSF